MSTDLALISHRVDGDVIEQRQIDGYINATAMCRAVGRQFNDYSRLGSTRAYLDALESDTGIPVSELIQSVKGGNSATQGTWVHPKVALHLAQWLSPRFAVQVSNWVYDWMTGRVSPAVHQMPYHLRRYLKNRGRVPDGHFSMLSEMIQAIIAPMEEAATGCGFPALRVRRERERSVEDAVSPCRCDEYAGLTAENQYLTILMACGTIAPTAPSRSVLCNGAVLTEVA
jgi:hypothetical protein